MNTPTFGTGNGSIKSPCEHDLAGDASSAEWRNYCPNVDTLDALQSNQQERVPSDGTVILAEPLGGLATPIRGRMPAAHVAITLSHHNNVIPSHPPVALSLRASEGLIVDGLGPATYLGYLGR